MNRKANPKKYSGCPICIRPNNEVTERLYQVNCKICGDYQISEEAINDWLTTAHPERHFNHARNYILNHEGNEFISSEMISEGFDFNPY